MAVPRRTKLAYSFIELPINVASMPMSLFLGPYYTQNLGLSLGAVGLVMSLARLWDVVTDPLIGYLSDRTQSPIGRRRPWVLAGAPLLLFSVWKLFLPGEDVDLWYFATWLVLMWLGWTMVYIPYYAWGAELSPDYAERTQITSLRTGMGFIGSLIVVGGPALLQTFGGQTQSTADILQLAAVAALILFPVGMLLISFVPDRQTNSTGLPLREGVKLMWRNPPFRRLLFGFTMTSMGPALQGPVYVLFVYHVVESPQGGALILPFFIASNMMGVILWNWLAQRIEKHQTWMVAMGVMVTATPLYLLLGPGDLVGMIVVLSMAGVGAGCLNAVPTSMKADVVDLDTLESGEERAGAYFAAWSLAQKSTAALGPGLSYMVLAWLGFDPQGNNGPEEILALRIFFSGAPMFCYLGGLLLIIGYPITRQRHAELRSELEARSLSAR